MKPIKEIEYKGTLDYFKVCGEFGDQVQNIMREYNVDISYGTSCNGIGIVRLDWVSKNLSQEVIDLLVTTLHNLVLQNSGNS